MNRILISLLVCLLLCGCGAGDSGIIHAASLNPPTERPNDLRGLYVSGSTVERDTAGSIKAYPLPQENVYGIHTMGRDVLVFSGEEHTTLTLLTGDTLTVKGSLTLDHRLSFRDPSLQIRKHGLSYYREDIRQTVVLDDSLRETDRITAPNAMTGTPLLSADGNTLYYCTVNAICSWDRTADLHRTLKELSYPQQTLTGLFLADSVIQCVIREETGTQTLFLSTASGKLLHTLEGTVDLLDQSGRFYAAIPGGSVPSLVFGHGDQPPRELICRELTGQFRFLPHRHGAVSISAPSNDRITLEHYDLSSGHRTASLSLDRRSKPICLEDSMDGHVYMLCYDPEFDCKAVYRWEISQTALTDSELYTGPYHTAQDPDSEGLKVCRAYADALSEKYGVRIRIWKDAAAVQPWDYTLEPEHRVSVLKAALRELDRQLALYPEQVLTQTASHFSSLSICLVRQLTGTPESGSLDAAAGIQFSKDGHAYVAIALGAQAERTLYHELFHVMETHLLGNTAAFDRWDELNPTGFRYDNSYETNKTRNAGVYLLSDSRSFVDTYSMSYPREDRARILEYAILPGNEALFQTETMQRKLRTLCEGIREAYALEDWPEPLLWEQYLE